MEIRNILMALKNDPNTKIDYKKNLDEFWYFINERHNAYYKRFVLKQPAPWTNDRILLHYKFTNVYRELDRGTVYYLREIKNIPNTVEDRLFPTIAYRLLNRVETFEKIGYIPIFDTYNRHTLEFDLQKIKDKYEAVFTSAHSLPPAPKGGTKIDGYILMLDKLEKKYLNLVDELNKCTSLEKVWETVTSVEKVGPFYGYEIICDLILTKTIPFTEDDWVNPGPGCKQGIDVIFKKNQRETYVDAIKKLRSEQREHFKRLGLDFKGYKNPGYELSLRSIEHSLCEYMKYWKVSRGLGRARLHFKPISDNTYYDNK